MWYLFVDQGKHMDKNTKGRGFELGFVGQEMAGAGVGLYSSCCENSPSSAETVFEWDGVSVCMVMTPPVVIFLSYYFFKL